MLNKTEVEEKILDILNDYERYLNDSPLMLDDSITKIEKYSLVRLEAMPKVIAFIYAKDNLFDNYIEMYLSHEMPKNLKTVQDLADVLQELSDNIFSDN